MINHIQTLLLNESASVVQAELPESSYGYIDPAFTAVTVDSAVSPVHQAMLQPDTALLDRLKTVKETLPYFHDPEFSASLSLFDSRVLPDRRLPTSVFDFYSTLGQGEGPLPVNQLVSLESAPSAFLPTKSELDAALPGLRDVYATSKETVKRFTALLFALAIHLEAARLRYLSKTA